MGLSLLAAAFERYGGSRNTGRQVRRQKCHGRGCPGLRQPPIMRMHRRHWTRSRHFRRRWTAAILCRDSMSMELHGRNHRPTSTPSPSNHRPLPLALRLRRCGRDRKPPASSSSSKCTTTRKENHPTIHLGHLLSPLDVQRLFLGGHPPPVIFFLRTWHRLANVHRRYRADGRKMPTFGIQFEFV